MGTSTPNAMFMGYTSLALPENENAPTCLITEYHSSVMSTTTKICTYDIGRPYRGLQKAHYGYFDADVLASYQIPSSKNAGVHI